MESRELATRSDDSTTDQHNDEEDNAEMHEDADFNDLPVHFQSIEADGNGDSSTARPAISESVHQHTPTLMETGAQYFDSSVGLSQTYSSPPPTNRTESGCQYSPSGMYQHPQAGNVCDAIGNSGAYGPSYGTSSNHCGSIDSGRSYGPPSISSDLSDASNVGMAGRNSGCGLEDNGGHYNPLDPNYMSSSSTNNNGYGLSNSNGLCSTAVNTEESVPSGSNDQFISQLGGGVQMGNEQNAASGVSPAKPYQCPECDAGFTRVDHLNRHLKTQSSHFNTTASDKQYHSCPHCSKLFMRRDHMKRHTKIHVRGEPVKCVECQTWFPSKMDLTHHLLEAHCVLVYECNICSKGFFEAKYLTSHLREAHHLIDKGDGGLKQDPNSKLPPPPHTVQLPYRCGICSLSFVQETACNKHMISHTRRLTHSNSNPVDSLSLASSHLSEVRDAAAVSQLNAHLWPHAGWQPDQDGMYNGNMPALSPSQQQSEKESPYFGNGMSAQSFVQYQALMSGQALKPEPSEGGHAGKSGPQVRQNGGEGDNTGHGNKTFMQPAMARQMMQCTGKEPFLCGVCGFGFMRAHELKSHMRKHTGLHRFSCFDCGAGFASSSNLIRHQRTHSGERPFKCPLCSAAFTHKGALINHERIHTGERPYVCELCEAAFARVDALSRHKKTHKENRIKEEEEGTPEAYFGLHA